MATKDISKRVRMPYPIAQPSIGHMQSRRQGAKQQQRNADEIRCCREPENCHAEQKIDPGMAMSKKRHHDTAPADVTTRLPPCTSWPAAAPERTSSPST